MPTEEYKKAYIFLSNKCSKKEISSRVREELDYFLEQKHMELFNFIFIIN